MRLFVRAWRDLTHLFHRPDDGEMPAAPLRQHLIVALAAVAVTIVVVWAMVRPQLEAHRARERAAVPKPCAPGQTQGCIGGTMGVIVAPSASLPSR